MTTAPILLGTAGHIDHGKTTLVRALTGIDTDRLKEEQARGITIELGFAHLDAEGVRFGLVDVPGHERFLKAMVAGATGMDLVLLVVAADEGVMPQTREHLDVCQLLGLRRGVVALTKIDLVDDEWRGLVSEEVRGALRGSFLADAPIIPVSARSGEGLDVLRQTLVRLASGLAPRPATGPWRLPVDRVFTLRGFGTVVTGTLAGGRVRPGEDAVILPAGTRGKVRTVQVHGEAADEARAGMRCALNLAGVELGDVRRGDVIAAPDTLAPSQVLDVRFHLLPARDPRHAPAPLGRRTRLIVHHGTAQLLGQLVLVDRGELAPGEDAFAQLRLETPVAALPGDHFLARGFRVLPGHGTTIGGGEIVRVAAAKVRRPSTEAGEAVARFARADVAERVGLEVLAAGPAGITRPDLAARLGLAADAVDDAVGRLSGLRTIVVEGDLALHAEVTARLERAAQSAVEAFHEQSPAADGMAREELRSRLPRSLPARAFAGIVAALVARGVLEEDRDLVRRARRPRQAAAPLVERLVAALHSARLETARPADLASTLGVREPDLKVALDTAVRAGSVIRIRPDYFIERTVLDDLRTRLRAHLEQHGQIDAQQWKTLTGASRKFTIPLAEHFDAEKVTLRIGDLRKLRK